MLDQGWGYEGGGGQRGSGVEEEVRAGNKRVMTGDTTSSWLAERVVSCRRRRDKSARKAKLAVS